MPPTERQPLMDQDEIDTYLAILNEDSLTNTEKFGTALHFINRLLGALEDAEEALATYQSVGDGKFYYYVSFAHHGGFGGTQVEMDAPISSGMDVLDLMELIKAGPNEPGEVVVLGWQELDRL